MPLLPLLSALLSMSAALIAHALRAHDAASEMRLFWVAAYGFGFIAVAAFLLFAVAIRRRAASAFVVATSLIAASTVIAALAFGVGEDAFRAARGYWGWLLVYSVFGATTGIAHFELKPADVWRKIAYLWALMTAPALVTFMALSRAPRMMELSIGVTAGLIAFASVIVRVAKDAPRLP